MFYCKGLFGNGSFKAFIYDAIRMSYELSSSLAGATGQTEDLVRATSQFE